MTGRPRGEGSQSIPANLSSPGAPNAALTSCWLVDNTLTQNFPLCSMTFQLREVFIGQNSTSGGSSDKAANDWQANPTGTSSVVIVVITVTPVQN